MFLVWILNNLEIKISFDLSVFPLWRPKSYSSMWVSASTLLIATMSTKIEYDNAISTIGILPTFEPCPNIYNLLKLEEIINTRLKMIPSTQFTIFEWEGMFIRPEMYALSDPDTWQDPVSSGEVPPGMGNPMAIEAKHKHHQDLWRIPKLRHDSFIKPSIQCLTRTFHIKLNQFNKLEIMFLESTQLVILWMLFPYIWSHHSSRHL